MRPCLTNTSSNFSGQYPQHMSLPERQYSMGFPPQSMLAPNPSIIEDNDRFDIAYVIALPLFEEGESEKHVVELELEEEVQAFKFFALNKCPIKLRFTQEIGTVERLRKVLIRGCEVLHIA